MSKIKKQVKAFRLDPEIFDKARKTGVNLAAFIEAALADLIHHKKCPYCGSDISQKPDKSPE